MLYPFMTLEGKTEVVHSEAYMEDGKEKYAWKSKSPWKVDSVLRNVCFLSILGRTFTDLLKKRLPSCRILYHLLHM